jgi:hypothetical protein
MGLILRLAVTEILSATHCSRCSSFEETASRRTLCCWRMKERTNFKGFIHLRTQFIDAWFHQTTNSGAVMFLTVFAKGGRLPNVEGLSVIVAIFLIRFFFQVGELIRAAFCLGSPDRQLSF